jgi:hypothetical protein
MLVCLVFFGTWFGAAGCGSPEEVSVPTDFKLVAVYLPGFSDWKGWKSTITADGKVVQEIHPGARQTENRPQREETKNFALTDEDLKELVATVRESRFFALEKKHSVDVTDSSTLVLRVTMNGKSHEVEVYAARLLKDKPEVKRFLRIWNEVLTKVPSPNLEQKPE